MENRAEFDLNEGIEVWKSLLHQNKNLSHDNVAELEDHLHNEIDELMPLGLSNEESFLVAKSRVGEIEVITSEFSKINSKTYFKNKALPYLKGGLLFMAFFTVTDLITNFVLLLTDLIGVHTTYIDWSLIVAFLLLSLSLLISIRVKVRNKAFGSGLFSSVSTLVGIIVVSKLLTFGSLPFLTRSLEVSTFGMSQTNLSIYKLLFGMAIVTISVIWFWSPRLPKLQKT